MKLDLKEFMMLLLLCLSTGSFFVFARVLDAYDRWWPNRKEWSNVCRS